MEKIYVVNRVLNEGLTITKTAFKSKKLANNYRIWANKYMELVPSWTEEIEICNFDYLNLNLNNKGLRK